MAVHLISHPTSLVPGIWQIEDPLPMSLVSTRHVAVILRPAVTSEKITKGGRLAVREQSISLQIICPFTIKRFESRIAFMVCQLSSTATDSMQCKAFIQISCLV